MCTDISYGENLNQKLLKIFPQSISWRSKTITLINLNQLTWDLAELKILVKKFLLSAEESNYDGIAASQTDSLWNNSALSFV